MAPPRVVERTNLEPLLYGPGGQPLDRAAVYGGRESEEGPEPDARYPDSDAPRQYVPPFGSRMQGAPRRWAGKSLLPFDLLKQFAEFDYCALAMSDLINQVSAMTWGLRVADKFEAQKDSPEIKNKLELCREWTERPDPENDVEFPEFVSGAIEEILTTDALTIYPQHNLAGEFIGLWRLDGATIEPKPDALGRYPGAASGKAAYYQYAHGLIDRKFTIDQLWYMPTRRRADCPYGFPPAERVLFSINLATRGKIEWLNYYTHGNTPDAVFIAPEGWGPETIAKFEDALTAQFEGRADRRVQHKWLPFGSQFQATHTREHSTDQEEWWLKAITYAYGVSPARMIKLLNRAGGEVMETAAIETGARLRAAQIRRLFMRLYSRILNAPEIEFYWQDDETEDPTIAYTRGLAFRNSGAISTNSLLTKFGEKTIDEPWADKHLLISGASVVSLEDELSAPPEDEGAAGQARPSTDAKGIPATALPPAPGSADEPEPEAKAVQDLDLWQRVALGQLRKGRAPGSRIFASDAIPALVRVQVEAGLAKAATIEEVREVFRVPLAILRRLRVPSPRAGAAQPTGSGGS